MTEGIIPDLSTELARIMDEAERDMTAILMTKRGCDVRFLIYAIAAVHQRATDEGNQERLMALEGACLAIADVYGLPVSNANLFLASYWPYP